MVMSLNKEALEKYGIIPNKFSYNNLLICYAKSNKPNEAENVLREMIDKGIKPDVVTYTTLIDAYKRVDNFDKCWELFSECRHFRLDGSDVDE
jgi:pentatricopeptide repeat protein